MNYSWYFKAYVIMHLSSVKAFLFKCSSGHLFGSVIFFLFPFCFGEDGVGDVKLQIDDCLSVNCLTGMETVGGFRMALSQTSALSKQYLTLEDATHGSHPAYPLDQSGHYDHACSRV